MEKTIHRVLEKLFGFRASTAKVIADKLFDANPQVREFTVKQLMQFMGTDRMDLLRQHMASANAHVSRASAIAAGGNNEGFQ